MVDERRTGQSFESAFGPVPAAPLAALAAGLFLLGGVAQLSRRDSTPGVEKPSRRRRRFGVLAVLILVAVFFLRRALAEPPAEAEADADVDVDDSSLFEAEPLDDPAVEEEPEPVAVMAFSEPDTQPQVEVEEAGGWRLIAEARVSGDENREEHQRVLETLLGPEPAEAPEPPNEMAVIGAAAAEAEPEGDAADKEGLVARVDAYSLRQPVEAQ